MVDWSLLADALAFYRAAGYVGVDVPWTVGPAEMALTCPDPGRWVGAAPLGVHVGSAEQSFLQLELDGKLGRGRYVACTPCHRNEPVLDDLHRTAFMKVELYSNDPSDLGAAGRLLDDAERFMAARKGASDTLAREATTEGFDLTLNGIEVGSYGPRGGAGLRWACGTGVAEPRFTSALSKS